MYIGTEGSVSPEPITRNYGQDTETSLNSSLNKSRGNKLTILQTGIQVIKDGNVLDNDQLLQKIRVPEKITRKFTVARDFAE